jgi:hypothetical protein
MFLLQVVVDSFFFGCCLNISGHFKTLRNSFDGDKRIFIDKHLKLLDVAEEVNQFFKMIIFTEFTIISALLCGVGFQVVMLDTFGERIFSAIFGITMLIQLFIYAYGGQQIINESTAIGQNLYDMDSNLILVVRRALKPTIIKSVFFTADLPSFVTIINATGSLITMLKSLAK